jgi:hypothetical protein
LLRFLSKPYALYLAVAILFLSSLGGSYYWGRQSAKNDFIQQQAVEFEKTTIKVNRGINEVRQANPYRDPSISLDRLRDRQNQR